MRSVLTATWMLVALGTSAGQPAHEQRTTPGAVGGKPKPVATILVRPALESPADTANAMAQDDIVRAFLKANGVNAAGGSTDARASVVRVICARK